MIAQSDLILWIGIAAVSSTLIVVTLQAVRYFRENPRDKDDKKPKR